MVRVGHQREELNIRFEGKEIKQVDGFGYLGGMVTEDGHSAAKVRRRTQAGANVWREVEGVMLDRKISIKLKGKALRKCVTPACLYGLETVALTEQQQQQQQQKLQVCENNWVRRITRTKRVERRRINDLERKNRKSGSTIVYLTLYSREQGGRAQTHTHTLTHARTHARVRARADTGWSIRCPGSEFCFPKQYIHRSAHLAHSSAYFVSRFAGTYLCMRDIQRFRY